MKLSTNPSIFPLGDSAITIDLGNHVDDQLNRKALALQDWLQARRFPGVIDIIVAYSSVSVFYDPVVVRSGRRDCPDGVSFCLRQLLQEAWEAVGASEEGVPEAGHLFRIPVCYEGEYAPDLEWVAAGKGISPEEVVRLHHAVIYHVYMIGFLPGFPYMGKTDTRIGVPRKDRPVPVTAGGVGIAGVQTGIYPVNSPGGWQIIGRTPIRLFKPENDPPVHLQAGDRVQFYPIAREEFLGWGGAGPRLP